MQKSHFKIIRFVPSSSENIEITSSTLKVFMHASSECSLLLGTGTVPYNTNYF
jgi:hypothetical protein